MCEIVDNYAKEVAKEKVKEMVAELFRNGVDFDVVCRSIGNLSVEELRIIYEGIKRTE